jgi:hypothetical protein
MDELTARIAMLVKAVKVVGVYDASSEGVQRMLNEGVDNVLIPVNTWAAFAEKGGVKGAIDWLPLDMVLQALTALYQAREASKQVVYEITGLSDIIRGSSVASETATAQQIKSQFASLRIKALTNDIARFASDLLRMKAQIMCSMYRPEVLVAMSSMESSPDAQYIPQAIQLLQNDVLRAFRIEVATDSLVELDEAGEKASRLEFLTAAGGFIREAAQAPPAMAPVLAEMLMFGVRSFKAGQAMEASLEQYIAKQSEQAKQPPQPPPPDPAMMKIQSDQQMEQGRMQFEQMKMQAAAQSEQMRLQSEAQAVELKAQRDQQTMQHDMAMAQARQEHEDSMRMMEAQRKAEAEIKKAEINAQNEMARLRMDQYKADLSAQTTLAVAEMGAKTAATPDNPVLDSNSIAEVVRGMLEEFNSLPSEILRGADGRVIGIKRGNVTKNLVRGSDGKAIGVK